MSIFKTQKSVDQERKTWERAEAEKVKAAQLTEAERFKFAARGLARVTLAAEEAARASGDEAAEVKAVALRRRLAKCEALHADYTKTAEKVADTTAMDAARDAFERSLSKGAAKLEALLPGIHPDEAARLVNKYNPPSPERRALLAEEAVAGILSTTKMRIARELWTALDAAAKLAVGADAGAKSLVERGRGQ